MEYKTLDFEIKEIVEDGGKTATVTGYAAVFGNKDSHSDVIMKGAFSDWIAAGKVAIPILLDHDPSMKTTAGFNVKAEEDDFGLFVVGELNLETESGRLALTVAKHAKRVGRNMGLSIGYITEEKEFQDDVRLLMKVSVMEYSILNFASNKLAGVVSVKSLIESGDQEQISHKKKMIERALRDAGLSKSKSMETVSFIFSAEPVASTEEEEEVEGKAEAEMLRELTLSITK